MLKLTLSKRDKTVLSLAGAVLLVIFLYLLIGSFFSGASGLEKKVKALEQELGKIKTLQAEYLKSKRRLEELEGDIKMGTEPIISVAEKILVESGIEREKFSIRSRTPESGELYEENSVDVEIKKIPLRKMVDVLHKVETYPSFLKITRFRPQLRFNSPDLLDVSFRISTYQLKKES